METIKIIFYGAMIIIFFVLPTITLLIRVFQKPFKRYSRGVPEPPQKLRDRYNEKFQKNVNKSIHSEYIASSATEKSPDMMDAIIIGSMLSNSIEEMANNDADDYNRIIEASSTPDVSADFGSGGTFGGSGASASCSDDNSSSYSSSYDHGSSSSSDSSSYDSSSSNSDY